MIVPHPILTTLSLTLFLATAGSVSAHSEVDLTNPPDGAVLIDLPDVVEFQFDQNILLTRVTQTGPDGVDVDLDLSAHDGFAKGFAVPLAPAGEGRYRLEWRGLSADGHAMQGALGFDFEAP